MRDFWGLWWEDSAAQRSGDEARERGEAPAQASVRDLAPEDTHALPSGHRQAMAFQARFGNAAVAQMVQAAAQTHAGRTIDPVEAGSLRGANADPGAGTRIGPAEEAVPGRHESARDSSTRAKPLPLRSLDGEPDPVLGIGPAIAPKPLPRAAETAIGKTGDADRAAVLSGFLGALTAAPRSAPWAALVEAYRAAPGKAMKQAAEAIAAVLRDIDGTERKMIDKRLDKAERGDAAEFIKLIRARLATATIQPAPPPPPAPPPDD